MLDFVIIWEGVKGAEGAGIPLLSGVSHLPGASIETCRAVDGLTDDSVLVYDWRTGRQEPIVTGTGDLVITQLYS